MEESNSKRYSEPVEGKEAGKLWHRRLEHAMRVRADKWNADKQWRRSLLLDRGAHWDEDVKGEAASSESPRDRITVNITRAQVRDFLAFLFKYTPRFIAKPRRREDRFAARIQAALLNYFWKEKNWKRQVRWALIDLIRYGTAVVRTGWAIELDESVAPDEDGNLNYDDAVRQDEPIVKRVGLDKFIVDPFASEQDLATARWCAQILHKPLVDVIANDRYDADVRRRLLNGDLKPAIVTKDGAKSDGPQLLLFAPDDDTSDRSTTLVRIFDVWDKKYKKHRLLLDGIEEPLLEEEWPYEYLDGFPFVMAVFDEEPDEMYGVGIPWLMEDQQLELNRIRTSEFQHRRNFGKRRLQILRNALDPAEHAKLQNGSDADIIVGNPNAIKPLEYPSLPADNYKVEEIIKEDVRNLTGSDQLTSGGNLPSRTSATEINARAGYTGMKIDLRTGAVDCFVTDISRQILQHMKANLQMPVALRIQGAGGEMWAEVSKADIREEVDLELTTVSAERTNPEMERQQAMMAVEKLTQAQPLLAQQGKQVDIAGLYKWLFEEKFDMVEYDDFVYELPPAPMIDPATGMPTTQSGAVPGIPPQQQAAQMSAVQPASPAMGAMMGQLGG